MGALTKDRLIFDPADTADSDNIGSYLRAGSDGDLISSTLVGGKEALDVYMVQSADNATYDEDTAHVSGDAGKFILGVRNDNAATSLTSADGDYSPIAVDEFGRLFVNADISVTTGFEKAEDSAHVSGDIGGYVLAVRQDTLANSTSADGDYGSLKLNVDGALWTAPVGNVADDAVDAGNPIKVGSRAVGGALPAISASGDRANLISDMYRRVWINDSPNIGVVNTVVTVGATEVALPAVAQAGRRRMVIQNTSSNDVYVGATGISTTSGVRIAKSATLTLEIGENVNLFAIAAGAGNDVRVMELA